MLALNRKGLFALMTNSWDEILWTEKIIAFSIWIKFQNSFVQCYRLLWGLQFHFLINFKVSHTLILFQIPDKNFHWDKANAGSYINNCFQKYLLRNYLKQVLTQERLVFWLIMIFNNKKSTSQYWDILFSMNTIFSLCADTSLKN